MRVRDWKWIVGILVGVIVYLLTYKIWGKSGDFTELISIGSGLVSIALAITAIIISVSEGIKASGKEGKVDRALDDIISNLSEMENLINKLNNNTTKTYGEVSKAMSYINDLRKFNNETSRTDESEKNKASTNENFVNQEIDIEDQQKEDGFYILKRGEIYFADLSPVVGAEQGGIRPVVVVQNDIANQFAPTVTVAPLTIQIQEEKLPTHVKINARRYQIEHDSVILLEQLRTISKDRLTKKITMLEKADLDKVNEALQIQMGLIDF